MDRSTISDFISLWHQSPFHEGISNPWDFTQSADAHVWSALANLDSDFAVKGDIAVHSGATIENGAILKGPLIVSKGCFVAASAYLRGGVFLDENCIIGPGAELKSSCMFRGSKLAHFNFVGDSILGSEVNVEAGAVVANYRNEKSDKQIRIALAGLVIETGVAKFGALVGDGVRIGANAVVAPGALIAPHAVVPRLSLVDQSP